VFNISLKSFFIKSSPLERGWGVCKFKNTSLTLLKEGIII